MMNKRIGLLLLAGVALAACGPVAPIDTDVKQAGANVFYGVPTQTPLPSLPPIIHFLNPVQVFPAPVEQPPVMPLQIVLFAPTPDPCPTLSPLSYPAKEATAAALHPPAPATYTFRRTGSITTNPGTAMQKVVSLPQSGTRQVTNVSAVGSLQDFSFDVVDTFHGEVSTTSYHVYPQGEAPSLPVGSGVAPGIYITAMVTTDAADPSQDNSFHPLSPGVEIFPFPAAPATTWRSAGTDPLTGATEVVGPTTTTPQGTATITDHVRVDACGAPIDAWEATMGGAVERAQGGPNSKVDFTLTIDMATQYGGLIVGDNLVENYTDQKGVPTTYSAGATIDVVPAAPPS